jgi:glycerophosphoryl diester phosphodiesterase
LTGQRTYRKPALRDLAQEPMVVAHRGFSGKAPENTMAAFTMALQAGVSMIELDVQVSKDNRVVVIHDPTVDRTTDGQGKVSELTVVELKKLDAGSWFDRKYSGEKIPTLEEALELIAPKVWVNIELKSTRILRKADTRIADATVSVVREKGLLNRVLFSSFNHKLMKYLKKREPNAHTGVIFHPVLHFGRMPSALALPAGAEVFVCSKREITKRRVNDAAKHNIIVGVYGIENGRDIEHMLMLGIRVLVSDYPDDLIRGIRQFEINKAS